MATSANATCRIDGAFPVGDIDVTIAIGQQPLNVTALVAHGDTVTASTELSPLQPGQHELSCTAQVATVAKTARRTIHVYSKGQKNGEGTLKWGRGHQNLSWACGFFS